MSKWRKIDPREDKISPRKPSKFLGKIPKICSTSWSTSNHALTNHWNITGTLPPAGKFKSQILLTHKFDFQTPKLYIQYTRQFLNHTPKCVQLIELQIEFYNRWLFNSYQHQNNSYFGWIKVGKNLPTWEVDRSALPNADLVFEGCVKIKVP
jgi:hypothetical protein